MEYGNSFSKKLSDRKYRAGNQEKETSGSPGSGERNAGRAKSPSRAKQTSNVAQTLSTARRPSSVPRSLLRTRANTEVKTLCSSTGEVLYYLGEQLGRGAYGVVYKAIEISTGYFVAVKQIPIEHMGPADREAVRNEIELLSKLNHFNIVKYSTVLHDERHISIVTEFMESGSLAGIVRRFGPLPETLIAWYVSQALKGLTYLHEQGVIHRDIKGANILLNKRAFVKLADFGVATKLMRSDTETLWSSGSASAGGPAAAPSIAGSPYWMAPEIIEMSGYGTASDIWSIGCTVIELFTGYPPYYELAPMSALFRIVSDEHPPLPPNVSEGMADFLLQCFQKDAERRPSAEMLLRHPWLVKRTSELKRAESRLMEASSDSDESDSVDMYPGNQPRRQQKHRRGSSKHSAIASHHENEPVPHLPVPPPKSVNVQVPSEDSLMDEELDDAPAAEDLDEEEPDIAEDFDSMTLRSAEDLAAFGNKAPTTERLSRPAEEHQDGVSGGTTDPNGVPSQRRAALLASMALHAAPASTKQSSVGTDHPQTSAHHDKQRGSIAGSAPPVRISVETLEMFAEKEETYDDLGIENEDLLLEELQRWRQSLHTTRFSVSVDMPSSDETDSETDTPDLTPDSEVAGDRSRNRTSSPVSRSRLRQSRERSLSLRHSFPHVGYQSQSLSLFSSPSISSAESEGDSLNPPTASTLVQVGDVSQAARLQPTEPADADTDANAIPRQRRRSERKLRHSDSLPRDRYERLVWEEISRKISALVRADLTLGDSKQRAVEAANSILELFREVQPQRFYLVTHHLLIPLMEVLDASGIEEQVLVERILAFLNEAAATTPGVPDSTAEGRAFREHLCIAGIVPILVEFSARTYNDRVRMQSAHLLAKMLHIDVEDVGVHEGKAACAPSAQDAGSETASDRRTFAFAYNQKRLDTAAVLDESDVRFIETFIASRGLRVFVHLLEPDFSRYWEMTLIALRGVALVMQTESQRRRHDICRLLARDGFLDRLSEALEWCIEWLAHKPAPSVEQQKLDHESPTKARQTHALHEEHVEHLVSRLVELWLLFPPADSVIEKHMARRSVLQPIVHILPALRDQRDQLSVLNSLRDLSGHQESHRALQTSGAITVLVGMLEHSMLLDGRIIITLFNLCRLRGPLETRERQEEAVCAHNGKLVRYLLQLARAGGGAIAGTGPVSQTPSGTGAGSNRIHPGTACSEDAPGQSGEHPLRGFAIEILCALDCSSERIRQVLWQNGVTGFLIGELLGTVVRQQRLRASKEAEAVSLAPAAAATRPPSAANTLSERGASITAPEASPRDDDMRVSHLLTSHQKAILESLVTWMHASKASLRQIEDVLLLLPHEPLSADAGSVSTFLQVLAELPFCNAETRSPRAPVTAAAKIADSNCEASGSQWLPLQHQSSSACHAEYILGPYREMIEASARFRDALSAYQGGIFCRRLARLALGAQKADVRRQALLTLSALMQSADPEVLAVLQQLAVAERSVLLQPEVKSILERFGYTIDTALRETSPRALQVGSASDVTASAPEA
jgi:serine/threonine protein kinase